MPSAISILTPPHMADLKTVLTKLVTSTDASFAIELRGRSGRRVIQPQVITDDCIIGTVDGTVTMIPFNAIDSLEISNA